MPERYFNAEQESYMRYIFSVPREQRCDCGWYLLGQCSREQCKAKLAAAPIEREGETP